MGEVIFSDSGKEILEWMWKEDKEYSYKDISLQFGENSDKGWKNRHYLHFCRGWNGRVSYLYGMKVRNVFRGRDFLRLRLTDSSMKGKG